MGTVEWISDGVNLPAEVEEAFWSDSLVFFCGAGVSSATPSNLPGFRGLAEDVSRTLGHPELVPADASSPVQFDVVMGKLDEISGDVHSRVSARLQGTVKPNPYHFNLLRVASAHGMTPRIVTTNFDLLFEAAATEVGLDPDVHVAPALPLGDDFSGVVHLHGILNPPPSSRMVLTDRDFGKAYITEGWATQFLTRMFARYTVVLIGYSAEDTIIQYLNRALPYNGERFAFTKNADEYENWERLGIRAMPFPSTPTSTYGALESFVGSWSARLSAEPTQRFDEIIDFVSAGPESAEVSPQETGWRLSDPALARHFRSHARAADWLSALDALGVLNALFDSDARPVESPHDWARWVRESIDDDDGELLLTVLAGHQGLLQPELWFQIWHKIYSDFNGSAGHRRLIFVLMSSQQPRESDRLSMLLSRTVEADPQTSELLLLHMLNPRLELKVQSGWGFSADHLETRLRLHWRSSSIRDAWPRLMPQLSDRSYLLSAVLDLIRLVEKTHAFFTEGDREDAISLRREQVEHAERSYRDDPYMLVVDIARDLLREQVRDQGTRDAMRLVEDRSEMVQRLALDALAEARSAEADVLVKLLMQRALPFEYRSKPEVFRLMAATYKHSSKVTRLAFIDYVRSTDRGPNDVEVSEYTRYNVFVWLSRSAGGEDPVQATRDGMEREHGFAPEEFPDLRSTRTFSRIADDPRDAEGRFRLMSLEGLVRALSEDQTLQDEYSAGPTLRELHDYLDHTVYGGVPLLDELIQQEVWNIPAWIAALQVIVRGTTWSAGDLLGRIESNAEGAADIAARLNYSVAYPENMLNRALVNAQERARLLLGLWRLANRETGAAKTADLTEWRQTARGSLARSFTGTLLRAVQQEGDEARIDEEGVVGLQQLLDAQAEDPADPSPMMLTEYASSLHFRAPEWFAEQLLPRLQVLDGSAHSNTLWAGLLARGLTGKRLRELLQEQVRTGWPQISRRLPASIEQFVQLHSICFVFDFGRPNLEWADAFLTHAPHSARARWIQSVAHFVDQEGDAGEYQELLFAHWGHRLDGQPPLSEEEQRAFLRWLVLPGIDVPLAAELFVRGPVVSVREEDLYGYYDLDEFPYEEHPESYLRVANHLMRGSLTLPPFVDQILTTTDLVVTTNAPLVRNVLNTLLGLGYSPARARLEAMG